MSKLKLIIGLGNPDPEYQNTYHNVGYLFVEYSSKTLNAKPYTILASNAYMNESGKFVTKEIKKAGVKPENLLIVHDDSDITLGKYKFSLGRGAAGHHGVESVQAALKTKSFWRLRIGIRPKAEANPPSLKLRRARAGEFVLKKINAADKKTLEATFEEIIKSLEKLF